MPYYSEVIEPNHLLIPKRLKTLTWTLETEQKKTGPKKPYLKVEIHSIFSSTRRLIWEKLYHGSESQGQPAIAFDGQGNLHRGYRTGISLFRQRVPNPQPGSDFSSWTYFGITHHGFTLCARGAEIIYFFFNAEDYHYLYQHRSTNHGLSWTSSRVVWTDQYGARYPISPRSSTNYLAATFRPNGDIDLFNANFDISVHGLPHIYLIRRIGGAWQVPIPIQTFSIGDTYLGLGATFERDSILLIAIARTGRYIIYKNINLEEFISIPAAQGFILQHPFITTVPEEKRPSFLISFIEKYTGTEAISRPYLSLSLKDQNYSEALWTEPIPFNLTTEHGLAVAQHGNYIWAASAETVWRAPTHSQKMDIPDRDIISLNEEITPYKSQLSIKLNNSKGKYNNPGQGALPLLKPGSEIRLSPGYKTSQGDEAVLGNHYYIESLEHQTSPNERNFIITATSPWEILRRWTPKHTLRWNTIPVYKILEAILARVGIPLSTISCSTTVLGFIPDFTVNPGDNGLEAIRRLLSFVPDVLIFSQGRAYIINPSPGDIPVYEYGQNKHPIIQGNYAQESPKITHVQVIGRDIVVDHFNWEGLSLIGDRLHFEPDLNITTIPKARDRAITILREHKKHKARIITPANCALELYDVIEVTDLIAPVSKARYRVNQIELNYETLGSRYEQKLSLTEA